MASIQQSMNQLLGAAMGAATAGSYMYRQSPTYQRKTEIRNLKSEIEDIEESQAKLGELASGQSDDFENTPAYRAANELEATRYAKTQKLLGLDWDEATARRLAHSKGVLEEIARKEAEAAGLSRVETQSLTHREMFEALLARKEMLSAKEHGQLDTMYHRHLKKGDID